MRHWIVAAVALPLLAGGAALADGKIYVPLPDMGPAAQDRAEAEALLAELYTTLVVASNCTTTQLSAEEHSLLTDGFDLLAYGEMGFDTDYVVTHYEKPAFQYLDTAADPCGDADQRKQAAMARLMELGGSLEPLADQEQGYRDWRAQMDAIGN